MKKQNLIPLSRVYDCEEDFNSVLANNIGILGIGQFEDTEREANVGTRFADIVATSPDDTLVVEVQFGKANWDHWGRLEAYSRIKCANSAVLVAEEFEELMIVTCNLRNRDSDIDWFLIQAQVNDHKEFTFNIVARPDIDVQTERKGIEYSKFWAPIREKGLFAGKPVPLRDEGWISKGIKGTSIALQLKKNSCHVLLGFKGSDRIEKRDKMLEVLSDLDYEKIKRDSPKFANIVFPVMEKGKDDEEAWNEIREQLIKVSTDIYEKIRQSQI